MTRPAAELRFADAVRVVRSHLIAQDPALHVGTRVPNPRPDRFVLLRRGGGVVRFEVVDHPVIAVDCWDGDGGTSAAPAMALAQQVRQWLHQMVGQVVDGAPVATVTELAGPADLPDDGESLAHRVRQTFEIGLRGRKP